MSVKTESLLNEIKSFVHNHEVLCVLTLGLAIIGFSVGKLAGRAIAWIQKCCGTTKKTDYIGQKIFNNNPTVKQQTPSSLPLDVTTTGVGHSNRSDSEIKELGAGPSDTTTARTSPPSTLFDSSAKTLTKSALKKALLDPIDMTTCLDQLGWKRVEGTTAEFISAKGTQFNLNELIGEMAPPCEGHLLYTRSPGINCCYKDELFCKCPDDLHAVMAISKALDLKNYPDLFHRYKTLTAVKDYFITTLGFPRDFIDLLSLSTIVFLEYRSFGENNDDRGTFIDAPIRSTVVREITQVFRNICLAEKTNPSLKNVLLFPHVNKDFYENAPDGFPKKPGAPICRMDSPLKFAIYEMKDACIRDVVPPFFRRYFPQGMHLIVDPSDERTAKERFAALGEIGANSLKPDL